MWILIVLFLILSAFLLERKIISDYNRELKKYNIKVELNHSLDEPWEVSDEKM